MVGLVVALAFAISAAGLEVGCKVDRPVDVVEYGNIGEIDFVCGGKRFVTLNARAVVRALARGTTGLVLTVVAGKCQDGHGSSQPAQRRSQ